jgi:hypothetical protein
MPKIVESQIFLLYHRISGYILYFLHEKSNEYFLELPGPCLCFLFTEILLQFFQNVEYYKSSFHSRLAWFQVIIE